MRLHLEDRGPNGRWVPRCAADLEHWPCIEVRADRAGVTTAAGKAAMVGMNPLTIAAIEREAFGKVRAYVVERRSTTWHAARMREDADSAYDDVLRFLDRERT